MNRAQISPSSVGYVVVRFANAIDRRSFTDQLDKLGIKYTFKRGKAFQVSGEVNDSIIEFDYIRFIQEMINLLPKYEKIPERKLHGGHHKSLIEQHIEAGGENLFMPQQMTIDEAKKRYRVEGYNVHVMRARRIKQKHIQTLIQNGDIDVAEAIRILSEEEE